MVSTIPHASWFTLWRILPQKLLQRQRQDINPQFILLHLNISCIHMIDEVVPSLGVWTREVWTWVWTGELGMTIVDKRCMYVDAFDKGMDGRTMEGMSVELSSIFEDPYMSNVHMI
ncbi:hypothetical protein DY000_02062762 [Brassica cretica]|uniref:Uncharacterized protein n=1 Tax=Brassica cretica TaxID=69181 RepID=A0ABQ7B4E9_BRACR|nr:hypothetical protein DY000_02062762 [Brassica cretica]